MRSTLDLFFQALRQICYLAVNTKTCHQNLIQVTMKSRAVFPESQPKDPMIHERMLDRWYRTWRPILSCLQFLSFVDPQACRCRTCQDQTDHAVGQPSATDLIGGGRLLCHLSRRGQPPQKSHGLPETRLWCRRPVIHHLT